MLRITFLALTCAAAMTACSGKKFDDSTTPTPTPAAHRADGGVGDGGNDAGACGGACSGATPHCNTVTNTCVACVETTHSQKSQVGLRHGNERFWRARRARSAVISRARESATAVLVFSVRKRRRRRPAGISTVTRRPNRVRPRLGAHWGRVLRVQRTPSAAWAIAAYR